MKKWGIILIFALLLTGCGKQETFERVSDTIDTPAMATMQQTLVELPEDCSATVMETDTARLYFGDNYTISRFVIEGGDLARTVKTVSGFSPDQLQLIQTQWYGATRYDFVWTSAGETGQQLCRASLLDDGNYHYILTVSTDADQAGAMQETWCRLFNSFRLVSADFPLDTGS